MSKSMVENQKLAIEESKAARVQAATPTAAEQRHEARAKAAEDFVAKKDYSSAPAGMVSLNYADPAQRRKMREREMNMTPSGATAFGAADANPTALMLAKEHIANQNDLDAAGQYESDLTNYVQGERNADLGYGQMGLGRNLNLLASSRNMEQYYGDKRIQTQPQSMLPGLLAAGIGAAGMFLGGPAMGTGGLFSGKKP